MLKILTIIGARPQIIKAAAISRVIQNNFSKNLEEYILHTGQHYDANMSAVFFDELGIPKPNANLNVGSKKRDEQIAEMKRGITQILELEKPNCVLVYGDTNSTNAGSVAAAKMNIPVIHIEAGLRSFNDAMPEEANRIICDNFSTLLFCPTETAVQNLINEGFVKDTSPPFNFTNKKIYQCGDIMYDNSLHFSSIARKQSNILSVYGLVNNEFVLATVHRDYNTDSKENLNAIFNAFIRISDECNLKIVLPLHPRTEKILQMELHKNLLYNLTENDNIMLIPPVSYLDMIALESNSKIILTDSGGVQKESFFFKKPCVVLRSETEWTELVENGNNVLANADTKEIVDAFLKLYCKNDFTYPAYYGNGKAAEFICGEILTHIS